MKNNIQEIAPLLADHFMDIDSDATAFEIHDNLVADNASRLGLYHKYIGNLHDSWFINTKINADKFSITLNDFTTHAFSDVIVERKKLNIDHDKLVFPVQIDFETISLSFNTVDNDGNIHRIEPTSLDEYLYEQIILIDKDKIEIGLVVWQKGNDNKPGQRVLILMSVKSIILTEMQDKVWTEIFGNTYDNYYQYFKTQLEKGRFLSDQSKCKELYNEFEELLQS